MKYNSEKMNELVDQLAMIVGIDSGRCLHDIKTERLVGDMCPYSDGDDMIDSHIDIVNRAEEIINRFNR